MRAAIVPGLLLSALFVCAVPAAAIDLKITDARGTQLLVADATIDYGGLLTLDVEKDGLRVNQGDGSVTVKWTDIDSVTVTKVDGSVHPARVDLEVALRNGKKVPATLFRQGKMKLLGKTDLGDYSIDLDKVRSIVPAR